MPASNTAVPDPERHRLLESARRLSPLEDVAEAISVATAHVRSVYVERTGDLWRWNLFHRGGLYPLWRETAQFLRVDYRRLLVGGEEFDGGSVVAFRDRPGTPDQAAIVEFSRRVTPKQVAAKLVAEMG